MRAGDSKNGYGVVSMLNHWLIGLMVIALIIFGLMSAGMGDDPQRREIIAMHKASGVIVLVLAFWRVAWRLRQGFPEPTEGHPKWQISAAAAMHWFLMIAIILMPLSGLLWSMFGGRDVSVFGIVTIPGLAENEGLSDAFQTFHRLFSKVLIAAILGHALVGIYQSSVDFGKSGGRMFIPK